MKKFFISACALLLSAQPLFAEKVFNFSMKGTPTNLDPVTSATLYANNVVTSVYDTLYEYKYLKRPFELKPNLAKAMPTVSADGLTYTIEIKKGVHFIDDPAFPGGKGREVVANDFVYSLKRHFDAKNRSRGSWLWQNRIVGLDKWKEDGSDYSKEISGLKAIGKYKIQVKLVAPFPQLLYTMAMGYSAIVPVEAVKKYGKEFSVRPVGSGPFRLTSFNSQKAILVRNEKYRAEYMDLAQEGYDPKVHSKFGIGELQGKRLPIVDRVNVHFMKEPSARWNSFTKGNEVQNTLLLLEQMRNVLKSKNPVQLNPKFAAKYHFLPQVEFGYVYQNFNMDDPKIGYHPDPVQNKKNKALRCAIRKGFNWPQRVKRFYMGLGEAFPGIIPPGIDGYDPNLSKESITYDPKGAKRMLRKAGWNARNLPILEYHNAANTRNNQMYEQFRGWMTRIGYPKRKIRKKFHATFGDFSRATELKKAMFFGMGWGLDYPDAENVLQLYYGPNGSPGSNSANFKNPEYDRLYRQASTMQPSPARSEIYKKMHKILLDECAMIGGFSRTEIAMWHKNLIAYPTKDVIGNYSKYVDVK